MKQHLKDIDDWFTQYYSAIRMECPFPDPCICPETDPYIVLTALKDWAEPIKMIQSLYPFNQLDERVLEDYLIQIKLEN